MTKVISQAQRDKFKQALNELAKDGPKKFKEKWDQTVSFLDLPDTITMPVINEEAMQAMPDRFRDKFILLTLRFKKEIL